MSIHAFDETKHPRGGHLDNPGKFSVAARAEADLDDLTAWSDPEAHAVLVALRDAIGANDLAGETWVADGKVTFRDPDGVDFTIEATEASAWAYRADRDYFEASYFDAQPGKLGDAGLKALREARTADASAKAWERSLATHGALVAAHSGVFAKTIDVTDDALVVNGASDIHRVRFSGFEAADVNHDGRASMSVQLADADLDRSYVITCDPTTEELAVFRGYDTDPMPHWEATSVYTQIRARSGLDERSLTSMLATPARTVADTNPG